MAKKVPVTVFTDPEVETAFTIKPFAAELAITPQAAIQVPEGMTQTLGYTNLNNQADVDADVDYNG
jgi:hypothetical protein